MVITHLCIITEDYFSCSNTNCNTRCSELLLLVLMPYIYFSCLGIIYKRISYRCCTWMWRRCCKEKELRPRFIQIGKPTYEKFPTNVIRNQKYSIITFLPMVCNSLVLTVMISKKCCNKIIF